MPPHVSPSVPLVLDRPRTLRFTLEAVMGCDLELTQRWGRDYTFYEALRTLALVLVNGDASRLSLLNLSVLLWQGLRHEDPALTLAQVQAALPYYDPSQLLPYLSTVLEAWHVQTPGAVPQAAEAEGESDPLAASTGASSGAMAAWNSA